MLRFPAISQLYKELSVLSSFEAWLTALSMKLAGEKKKSNQKSLKNAHKVNWHNPLQGKNPGTQEEKKCEEGIGRAHQ